MYTYFYGAAFIVSLAAVLYIARQNYKSIDVYHWAIVMSVQFVNAGYFAISMTHTLSEAVLVNDLICVDGTLLPALFLLSMMRSFRIEIAPRIKLILYGGAFLHLFIIWLGSSNGLYYRDVRIMITERGTLFSYNPGPFMLIHFIYLLIICVAITGLIVYSMKRRNVVSVRVLCQYSIIAVGIGTCYLLQCIFKPDFQFLPVVYTIVIWMIVTSYDVNDKYDIEGIAAGMHEGDAIRGYVAFSLERRFLGANKKAVSILPAIGKVNIDSLLEPSQKKLYDMFYTAIDEIENGKAVAHYYHTGDLIYKYEVTFFYTRRRGTTGGYLFEFLDDTERQRHLKFVDHYNENLRESVREQSKQIRDIQQRVVLGLADMVENRDNSTGGHVKRTSDIIKILLDTMMDNHIGGLDTILSDDIVRAAPMHDLGKINIDSSILCKPGKLSEEEFEIMRTHSAMSGDIVRSILDGVEETHFVRVAYNIARYHHERWDGKGYPDKLAGNDIPLEARIMSVADVYDALVSKRCYKEAMGFDEAADVMLECMGSQFDPMMKDVFLLSRTKLEKYYSDL